MVDVVNGGDAEGTGSGSLSGSGLSGQGQSEDGCDWEHLGEWRSEGLRDSGLGGCEQTGELRKDGRSWRSYKLPHDIRCHLIALKGDGRGLPSR